MYFCKSIYIYMYIHIYSICIDLYVQIFTCVMSRSHECICFFSISINQITTFPEKVYTSQHGNNWDF